MHLFSTRKFLAVLLFFMSGIRCSIDSNSTLTTSPASQSNGNAPTCTANVPSYMKARSAQGSGGSTLEKIEMKDQLLRDVFVGVFDDCGQFLKNASVSSWGVVGDSSFYLRNTSLSSSQIYAHRGATSNPTTAYLRAEAEGLILEVPVEISWTITDLGQHLRWYRVDSLSTLSDGAVVGTNPSSALEDFGPPSTKFNSVVTAAGREPRFRTQIFNLPVLHFCGVSSACSGITMNSHLRIGSSFADYANKDLTFIYVVARANANANILLTNQSAGNNTGTFLGFTSNTNFRFGLAGPQGNPQLNVTIAGYTGTPQLEIWTARLDTNTQSPSYGMQVFRNGSVIGSTTTGISQQASATTIPLIGTQRSENNNAQFYLAEMATYTRALSDAELCSLHQFLADKYSLNLNLSCLLN